VHEVTLNGQSHVFPDGLTILEALRSADIAIPTLCHDVRLAPSGGCRLCVVELEGSARPVAACTTPLGAGMRIATDTPELESYRRTLLELLAAGYPPESIEKYPDKQFHRLLSAYQVAPGPGEPRDGSFLDDSHPYIHADMRLCVYCYRCVRICEELQGQFVWQTWYRGEETRLRPDRGDSLLGSSCVSCGACVDTCPTGALEDQSILLQGGPTDWTRTTCPYCGTGCEMRVGTREGRVTSIRPVLESPTSKGHLCVKGRYGFEWNESPERVVHPMLRETGTWRRVTWEEAIGFAAERMRAIMKEQGPERIGVVASSRATNEENYLAQKFTRVALGTNNVDGCARVCHTPSAAGLKMTLGIGAATNAYNDIERASAFLICGANPTENHPIVGARIKQQVLRGARLIVIDPRRIELAEYADIHLQLRPGTNIPLLNAMACAVLEEGLADEAFLAERVTGHEAFGDFVRAYAPEKVAAACGVEASLIRRAARLYAENRPAMCFHGLGVTEHTQGTEGVICLTNLALLCGNVGRPGGGVNPLRGQNNVQGCAQMGCDPGILTGGVAVKDGKTRFEAVWGAPIPTAPGLNLMEMVDAARDGKLSALWIIGYDLYLTLANEAASRRALENLDLLIVQDMFMTETAREFAHVFLPAASPLEKEGTFMSSERRIQRVRAALPPPGEARSDQVIINMMGHAMGKPEAFAFATAEEVWSEIRAVWPDAFGITYLRLESGGLQWPCPSVDHPGTEILHGESFPMGKTTALRRVDYLPTKETVDEEFPFLLVTGRTLHHFNAGTMTGRTRSYALDPVDCLSVAPADVERLGLIGGERVRVRSRYGSAELPVRVTPSVEPGQLFSTFHNPKTFLNRITSTHRDRFVKAPEYKVTAVRIEKL
jgi:formate dehydrogenase major subunit